MTKYLKLFLVHNPTSEGYYDTFDSMVVAAKSEEDARQWHPYGKYPDTEWNNSGGEWCKPEQTEVTYIGIATDNIEPGVICASFNAA